MPNYLFLSRDWLVYATKFGVTAYDYLRLAGKSAWQGKESAVRN
jgi:hypothetical protein